MNHIKNRISGVILGLTALVVFSINVYAQDSNQDQSRSQGQTQASQNMTSFGNDAQQLASRLAQQLGATTGVADKVTQILLDYRSNIASARQDFLDKNKGNSGQNNSGNQDVTGGQSRGGVASTDIDSSPDLMKDYTKADEQADKDIIDALDNDAQKAKYIQIKKQWWKDVKNQVYSTVKQSSGMQQNSGDQQNTGDQTR
ncbi:MAG: hypothetical protein ACM3P0_14205 [Acidobacteriota bacterium]